MKSTYTRISFLLFGLWCTAIYAQSIRINEVLPSNTIYTDEDGDTPDALELYNYGDTDISLEGFSLTDDINQPDKWIFSQQVLPARSYLWIWASGKDRNAPYLARTLVNQGDRFRYLVPQRPIIGWTKEAFNDLTWPEGTSGFGYGDDDDATPIPRGASTVYVRKTFNVTDVDKVKSLLLHIDYDDGFIAYLNGKEIARENLNAEVPAYNAFADDQHEALLYQGMQPELFRFDQAAEWLKNGTNLLCVEAHNISANSSDFSLTPFLSVISTIAEPDGVLPPEILALKDGNLHTNFKVSASGETVFLLNTNQEITDSLYVPPIPANTTYGYATHSTKAIFTRATPSAPNTGNRIEGQVQSEVVFSHPGGLAQPLTLQLSGNEPDEEIRFTLDATLPTQSSAVYTGAIPIQVTTVVRARIFKEGYLPSATASRSFLLNASHQMDVVSLITEPGNFFDPDTGMYVLGTGYTGDHPYFGSNIWEDWERPIHFSIYNQNGEPGTAFNGGLRIFGGWSRANEQRSFSIFARKTYGPASIEYPLFPDLPHTSYESVVMRNSGNDWLNTMFRDAMLTSLMKGSGIDYMGYRPVTTYINGEYWGFYNLREKISEHFVSAHHGIPTNEIDLLELNGDAVHGDATEYQDLLDYLATHSLAVDEHYRYVENRLDVENFITYQVAQIFMNNTDWPGNNIKYWKADGGKWRWILYDTDFGFGIWNLNDIYNNTLQFATDADGPNWPNPPWSTFLFRKLLENPEFKARFINYYSDELNTRFLPDAVQTHIQQMADRIEPEVARHYARWGQSTSNWYSNVSNMKTFASYRPTQARNHLREKFNLTPEINLVIDNGNAQSGYVQVNHIFITQSWWTGKYYSQVPVQIKAIARPGYHFSHWEGSLGTTTEPDLTLSLKKPTRLIPVFETNARERLPLVINEINYNAGLNNPSWDWVELYNPNPYEVHLAQWKLTDDQADHAYVLPQGTLIKAEGYLVLSQSSGNFASVYPQVKNHVGTYAFGFSKNADQVKLYNATGMLEDSVAYGSEFPWPAEANGEGFTLELIHPDADNTLPGNWKAIHEYGSPGISNLDDTQVLPVPLASLVRAYPNPASPNATVTLSGAKVHSQVQLTSMDGKVMDVGRFSSQEIHLPAVSQGVYVLSFLNGNGDRIRLKLLIE